MMMWPCPWNALLLFHFSLLGACGCLLVGEGARSRYPYLCYYVGPNVQGTRSSPEATATFRGTVALFALRICGGWRRSGLCHASISRPGDKEDTTFTQPLVLGTRAGSIGSLKFGDLRTVSHVTQGILDPATPLDIARTHS